MKIRFGGSEAKFSKVFKLLKIFKNHLNGVLKGTWSKFFKLNQFRTILKRKTMTFWNFPEIDWNFADFCSEKWSVIKQNKPRRSKNYFLKMQQNINCWCPIKQLTKGPGNGFVAEMIFGSQKKLYLQGFRARNAWKRLRRSRFRSFSDFRKICFLQCNKK